MQLASFDPSVTVVHCREVAPEVIFVDPDCPEEQAVLLIALFADVRGDVARGWLRAAYAQDPRRGPLEPAPDPGPPRRASPPAPRDPPAAEAAMTATAPARTGWRVPWFTVFAYPAFLCCLGLVAVVLLGYGVPPTPGFLDPSQPAAEPQGGQGAAGQVEEVAPAADERPMPTIEAAPTPGTSPAAPSRSPASPAPHVRPSTSTTATPASPPAPMPSGSSVIVRPKPSVPTSTGSPSSTVTAEPPADVPVDVPGDVPEGTCDLTPLPADCPDLGGRTTS